QAALSDDPYVGPRYRIGATRFAEIHGKGSIDGAATFTGAIYDLTTLAHVGLGFSLPESQVDAGYTGQTTYNGIPLEMAFRGDGVMAFQGDDCFVGDVSGESSTTAYSSLDGGGYAVNELLRANGRLVTGFRTDGTDMVWRVSTSPAAHQEIW